MQIWCLMYGLRPREWFRLMGKILAYGVSAALLVVSLGGSAMAQSGPLVLERNGRVISLEPYAPNILRVTMSIDKAAATGAPGYGFVGKAVRRRDGRTSAMRKATMCSDRPGWWCVSRRETCRRRSCRSRCRWMR